MRLRLVSLAAAASIALCSCATNTQLVTRLASESTACDQSAIEVEPQDQLYAGVSRYQTSGCGTTHLYECPKWDNIMMTSLGIFYLDQRRCKRIKR
jgi:hypothetical protein